MIRLRHETLPPGLSALLRRKANGDLEVIVSTEVGARRQRAAIRAGLRAMQPAGHRAGQIPVPALIMLAVTGTALRAVGRLIRLHPAASVAVAASATAAAVLIAVAPGAPGPAVAGRNPPAGAQQPGSAAGPTTAPAHSRATPSAPAVTPPQPSAMPVAAPPSTGAARTPAPVASRPNPASSTAQPEPSAPAPTPRPSKTGGGSGICIDLLGLWVCV